MQYQILLVEDDFQIQEGIRDYFTEKSQEDIEISVARNGDEGIERIYEGAYDLVILDIMLPGLDGFTLCRELRQRSTCPVIFLTAKGREEDILYGYDLGCDDYIVKPFSLKELYAKVNALLKRAHGLVGAELLRCGSISLNPRRLLVTVDEVEVALPPKEYALLKYLMEHKGSVVNRETLLIRIWGYDYEGSDRVVDNHIRKLRAALGSAGKEIKTVISRGYKMG